MKKINFFSSLVHPQSWIEKNSRKQNHVLFVWMLIVAIVIIVSSSIVLIFINSLWVFVIALLLFIITGLKTYYDGRIIISENHVSLLETLGSYSGDSYEDKNSRKTMKDDPGVLPSGMSFVFPYFSIYKIHDNLMYFMGRTQEKIFKDESNKIDFNDVSNVRIECSIVFKIIDPRKAAYSSDNYLKIIVDKSEEAVTTVMRMHDFEEAKKSIKKFNVFYIFSTEKERIEKENIKNYVPETIKNVERNYGIKIVDIFITDIQETPEQEKAKVEIMKKTAELSEMKIKQTIAEETKKITLITAGADADKVKIEAEADAEARRIRYKSYTDAGLTTDHIAYLEAMWAIQPTDKLIIPFGGSSGSSVGAELGFGYNFVGSNKRKKNN